MKDLYAEYIKDKAPTWSASSVRSESSRLNGRHELIDGNAARLWDSLKDLQPYARATYWTRVAAFYDWLIENGKRTSPNPYTVFRKRNTQCFRNAYVKRPCQVSMTDIKALLDKIPDKYEDIRNKCKQLLAGGLRRTESYTLADGYVTGKGGKVRRAYVPEILGPMAEPSRYSTMLKVLKKYCGITPHKLRSIKLTTMARKPEIKSRDLQEFAGWSSISTAESYVNANHELIAKLATED